MSEQPHLRRGQYVVEANLKDVAQRIVRNIRNWDVAQKLVEKVKRYWETHNERDDLSLDESHAIYRREDYGDTLPLSRKRRVDIDWSDHAEYRSDLRDVPHKEINQGITDWLKERLMTKGPDKKKVRMKLPGKGTAVVDYDLTRNPADADVVTVWASGDPVFDALREMGVCGSSRTAASQKIRWQAVFLIGPAGAGKSWLRTKKYLKYVDFKLVDPDEVKKTHPEYDPANPYVVHEWSKEVSDSDFKDIVTDGSGTPVVVDGTGRNAKGIERKARLAEANGYRTFLVYVWVPWQVSIYRNRNRDRFVPEDKILQAYKEIASSFKSLKSIVDKYKVIPNFTRQDMKEAEWDVMSYRPPQRVRPPRPGESDYEIARAASERVAWTDLVPGQNVSLVGWDILREEMGRYLQLSRSFWSAQRRHDLELMDYRLNDAYQAAWAVYHAVKGGGRIQGVTRLGRLLSRIQSSYGYDMREDIVQDDAGPLMKFMRVIDRAVAPFQQVLKRAAVSRTAVNLGPRTFASLVDKVSSRSSAEEVEAFQKNRMPQDRSLGTRVHRDKKKFHKTKRQKNKQNLKRDY